MTTKQRILSIIDPLPDQTSFEDAIDRLWLLRHIQVGLDQADAGDVMSHEEFMKELDDLDNLEGSEGSNC